MSQRAPSVNFLFCLTLQYATSLCASPKRLQIERRAASVNFHHGFTIQIAILYRREKTLSQMIQRAALLDFCTHQQSRKKIPLCISTDLLQKSTAFMPRSICNTSRDGAIKPCRFMRQYTCCKTADTQH